MRRLTFCTALAAALGMAGCQSHQAKVDQLQKQYDQLAKQFQQDCSAEYLDIPPKISPKCKDEDKRMKEAWNRLQAERSKK
jgi:23S rRNA pseudoU1915 N3-methylase RlmH